MTSLWQRSDANFPSEIFFSQEQTAATNNNKQDNGSKGWIFGKDAVGFESKEVDIKSKIVQHIRSMEVKTVKNVQKLRSIAKRNVVPKKVQ